MITRFGIILNLKKKSHNRGEIKIIKKVKTPEQLILERVKQNAREKNKEFNIEIDDIIIPKYCPYLGFKLLYYR